MNVMCGILFINNFILKTSLKYATEIWFYEWIGLNISLENNRLVDEFEDYWGLVNDAEKWPLGEMFASKDAELLLRKMQNFCFKRCKILQIPLDGTKNNYSKQK